MFQNLNLKKYIHNGQKCLYLCINVKLKQLTNTQKCMINRARTDEEFCI